MKRLHSQKGFTLVELAIVMTIIGLLIGGILKGQELMENARVTATVSQVKAFEAAVTTFRDSYAAMPGDMGNAADRIPGCNDDCDPTTPAQAGNGVVGDIDWGIGGAYAAQITTDPLPADAGAETSLFWVHLLLADLISGTTDAAIRDGTVGWGTTHPAARLGGGFVVGYGNGIRPAGLTADGTGPSGLVVALVQGVGTPPSAAVGTQPITPGRAAQIDRRIDDGNPLTGYVQAYGDAGTLGDSSGCLVDDDEAAAYLESVSSKDCGLFMRIQG